jgi:hypothetical protein
MNVLVGNGMLARASALLGDVRRNVLRRTTGVATGRRAAAAAVPSFERYRARAT